MKDNKNSCTNPNHPVGASCSSHVDSENICKCACHENKLEKPYGHNTRCCENINGYLESEENGWRDNFIRDVASVVPRPKSEVSYRLNEGISQELTQQKKEQAKIYTDILAKELKAQEEEFKFRQEQLTIERHRLCQVDLEAQREKIVKGIEKIKETVRKTHGTHKYDSCYNDCIDILKKH